MRRLDPFALSRCSCLELRMCVFAGLNALIPCVVRFSVPIPSAFSEPGTAVATTTAFAGFRHVSALEACGTGYLCRVCWCSYGGIGK